MSNEQKTPNCAYIFKKGKNEGKPCGRRVNKTRCCSRHKKWESYLMGHTDYVTCLAVLLDGVSLASGSEDKTVKVWNTTTGDCLRTLEGHTRSVECLAVLGDGVLSGEWVRG